MSAIRVVVAHDPAAAVEPSIDDAEQALRLGDIAVARALVLVVLAGKFSEKPDLSEHRAHAAHLEHQPLDRLVAAGRILWDEAPGLFSEIKQVSHRIRTREAARRPDRSDR